MQLPDQVPTADEFVDAYNAGDINKVLAYYVDDLTKLRNGAPFETKADIARRVSAVFEKFDSTVDVFYR